MWGSRGYKLHGLVSMFYTKSYFLLQMITSLSTLSLLFLLVTLVFVTFAEFLHNAILHAVFYMYFSVIPCTVVWHMFT